MRSPTRSPALPRRRRRVRPCVIAAALAWALLTALVAARPTAAGAQPLRPAAPWADATAASGLGTGTATPSTRDRVDIPDFDLLTRSGQVFFMSAILPGAGQWRLGSERWVPYLALEIWGWLRYFERHRRADRLERQYRDLAWAVARRVSVGTRTDGDWHYYESVGKYHASGVYDADPRTPGIQPERDISTYNGSMWNLARALHIPAGTDPPEDSPAYRAALEYYERRAVPPEMAWSWGDNGLEQQVFRELVRDSDEAHRGATRALGVILANHIVSAVDALVASRLRGELPVGADVEVESGLDGRTGTQRLDLTVRVPVP